MPEYVIWGVNAANGETEESILRTTNADCTGKIETREEAERLARWLERQGCTKLRIQEIDLSKPLDFVGLALGRR